MPRIGRRVAIGRELASARRSLRALEQSLARLAAQVRDISRNNSVKPAGKPRRKIKLPPARLKALRLHGRYLGYIRQLKPKAKSEVRALRAQKGVRAAIARARRLALLAASLIGYPGGIFRLELQAPGDCGQFS